MSYSKRPDSRDDKDMKIATRGGRPANSSTSRSSTGRPTSSRPAGSRPTSSRPSSGRPTGSRPTSSRPSSSRPAGSRPTSSQQRRGGASQTRKPSGNKKSAPQKERKWGMGCLSKIIYLAVILAISIVLSIYAVNVACDVFGIFQPDKSKRVTLKENITAEELTDLLYENHIIEYKWSFNLMQKLKHCTSYKGGRQITLNWGTDYSTILRKVRSDDVERETVKVTFPEGYTYKQIRDELVENKVCSAKELDKALNTEYDYEFFDDKSKNVNIVYSLEGYLFPDTYEFYVDDDAENVYNKLLYNLESKLEDKHYARAKELNMSMHEVLTLASIIQKEASKTSEMKNVSSVFHNRLKANMQLQTDVTVWYPEKKTDIPESERDNYLKSNQYNTYNINGLPPGPICNPGIDAIKAALYPEDTNYYYFVTDANGKYYYATTFEKHQANCATALSVGDIGGTETQ